jgi:hypothetical protein
VFDHHYLKLAGKSGRRKKSFLFIKNDFPSSRQKNLPAGLAPLKLCEGEQAG